MRISVLNPFLPAYKQGRDSIQERWEEVHFEIRDGERVTALSNPGRHPVKDALIKKLME